MKELLQSMLQHWRASTLAAKALVGIAIILVVGVTMLGSGIASRPSFVLLYSDLDSARSAAIQGALATAGVRYQASQPPGPFTIHVDEVQFYMAQNAVALSGALTMAPEGIQSGSSGATQVFLSAAERAQNGLKREWQELEKQLEELDFVLRSHVSTSIPETSALRRSSPLTVAITLTLRGTTILTRAQSETVAKLAHFRFNVPMENVLVTDQSGRSLFDGGDASGYGGGDLVEHRQRYDDDVAKRTNSVLDGVFGEGLARVVIHSDWKFEEVESVKETIDPKSKVVVSERSNTSETPVGTDSSTGGVGGAVGVDPPPTPITSAPAESQPPAVSKTNESQKSTIVGRETSLRRSNAPTLNKLSVSLFLDESQKIMLDALTASVKAAVGFDEKRGDTFNALSTPFASLKRDDKGALVPTTPPVLEDGPSRTTELLVQRGVEIAAALAFIFVLFKSLKSVARGPVRISQPVPLPGIPAPPPKYEVPEGMDQKRFLELLAKHQVEELVRSDPERVSAILARWASEEETVKAGR